MLPSTINRGAQTGILRFAGRPSSGPPTDYGDLPRISIRNPQVMQPRLPLTVLLQVFPDPPRKKDMPGIAAIHYPLRHLDARPGDILTAHSHRFTSLTGPQ